ncbi:MAG: multiheme c-type cytochrome [Sandaracinaceae bacterium]
MERRYAWAVVGVFLAVVLTAVVVDVQSRRPAPVGGGTGADLAEATRAEGRCVSCHVRETPAIVRQHLDGRHAQEGIHCFECHRAPEGAEDAIEHRGFNIVLDVPSGTCQTCHSQEYTQFLRSRHAAPAWAAVAGREAFTDEQFEQAHRYHPAAMDRPSNAVARMVGMRSQTLGCEGCHSIGEPNDDGSIGDCTSCHARHEFSSEQARNPMTCGNCHLGPDHSQIEIWTASRHGVVFHGRREAQRLDGTSEDPTGLSQDAPTCSTCHMASPSPNDEATHDVGERLSLYLYAPITEQRPQFQAARDNMTAVCRNCHGPSRITRFYEEADGVVEDTNERVAAALAIINGLREGGYLTPEPFDEPVEFLYFDLWHYFGRTAKHGAFMGGADFVQWHGTYELALKFAELEEMAAELRERGPLSAQPEEDAPEETEAADGEEAADAVAE